MFKFLRQLLFGEPPSPLSPVPAVLKAPVRPRAENSQRGRVKLTKAVPNALVQIFEEQYRELRPRAPIPPLDIRFRRFTSLNTTIRLREGNLHVRLSDLLEHAPENVHKAIAHILLAKLYKKPIAASHADRYRRHVSSEAVAKQAEHIRQTRGRKRITAPEGHHYDLNEVFDSLNNRFFHGLLGRPTLTWSAHHARRMLGHYDAAHNTIVVSRVFDRTDTPRCAIEYLLYHEMLHLKHPVRVKAGRRCVHSKAFQAEERLFPELEEAKAYLKML
jgi:predicted metal-dependent hydrolase